MTLAIVIPATTNGTEACQVAETVAALTTAIVMTIGANRTPVRVSGTTTRGPSVEVQAVIATTPMSMRGIRVVMHGGLNVTVTIVSAT